MPISDQLFDEGGAFYNVMADVFDDVSDSVRIQAAIDAASSSGGGTVVIPAGTFALTGPVVLKPNVQVAGAGATIDLSSLGNGIAAFIADAVPGSPVALTQSAPAGATIVKVSDPSGFVAGGWGFIRSQESTGSNGIKKGEIVRILAISGSDLTVSSLADSYEIGDQAAILSAPELLAGLRISGLRFAGGSDPLVTHVAIRLKWCISPTITDCTFVHCHHAGIIVEQSVGAKVVGSHFQDALNPGLGYGLVSSLGSQDLTMSACSGERLRHLFATGGSSSGYGPARRVTVSGCTARDMRDAGFDSHGGAEDIVFTANTVVGDGTTGTGIIVQASRFVVSNNTVLNVGLGGIIAQNRTNRPMSGVISGNIVRRTGGSGIVVAPDTSGTYKDYDGIVVSNNTVVDSLSTATVAGGIQVNNASGTYRIPGLVIEGNTIRGSLSSGIFVRGCEQAVVSNNRIVMPGEGETGNSAIYVHSCTDVALTGNVTKGIDGDGSGSQGNGFRIRASNDVCATANRARYHVRGVWLEGSDRTLLIGNNLRDCSTPIQQTGGGTIIQSTADASGAYNFL